MPVIPGKINRIIGRIENGKQVFISVVYESGRIIRYYHPFYTVPESVKHYIRNAYVSIVSPDEKLYKVIKY